MNKLEVTSKLNSRVKDYTGLRFGHLSVVGHSGQYTNQGNSIWECLCLKCGKTTFVSGGNLRNAVSCGCFRKTSISPTRQSKKCNNCKEEKLISEFGKNKSRKDGHSQFCKECIKVLDQKYRPNQREWRATYLRDRRSTSIAFRIADNLRRRVNSALHGKSKSSTTLTLIGCTIEELVFYLESKFVAGMCMDNYGTVWEIDHIIPCAKFDLSNPIEQQMCFHYKNLQPLFVEDNRKKSSWHNGTHYEY